MNSPVLRLSLRLALGAAVFVACYWIFLFRVQRRMLFPAPAVAGAPGRPAKAEQPPRPGKLSCTCSTVDTTTVHGHGR
jgi:hypothetical protein